MRKSVKLGPGVRLNASKTGLGASVGAKGGRYSVHSSGRRTASAGIPGSGVSYVKSRSGSRKSSAPAAPQAQRLAASGIPKPSLLAPAYEKAFAKGVSLYVGGEPEKALALFQETDQQAVLVTGHRPNHLLHLILSVLTLGLWLIVWLIVALAGGEKRKTVTVAPDGRAIES
jgi:hypothetical protein